MSHLIERVSVDVIEIPLARPVVAGSITIPAPCLVLVRLATSDGHEGLGFGIVLRQGYAASLASLTEVVAEAVVGGDPTRPSELWERAWRLAYKAGPEGLATWAVSAIDVAVWDLFGKISETSVHRLLGGHATELPAYVLAGLTHRDEAELLDQLDALVEEGHRHVKLFINGVAPDGDLAAVPGRIERLQEHVDGALRFGIDLQERLSPPEALRLGRALDPLDLFWIEEPVPHDDHRACASIAAELATPICGGEQRYGLAGLRPLIAERAVDVVMVDVRMAGGITPFARVAAAADVFGLPTANHMVTAIDVHVMGALPRPALTEVVPWTDAVFEEQLDVRGGSLHVPDRPGLGLTLNERARAALRS